ncbi:DUF3025 domain-containing protein [Psychrobacter sp. F1192]|uniref:DUF3025 domain-containing protein n=1 Tax=Psychrobacter coccoides TaxID=2818440 RepID=A0ABS3NRD8_9GAMM|nr:DUF3025 domain-containing protein [Psychrobacter coccoides]MBO1531977.1 DUF3025 domain-containing protein [Psychrobacter coccoides]
MTSVFVHQDTPNMSSILDTSFAAIDWQALWLSHLSQLDYLRKTITQLSNSSQRANTLAHDKEVDIIAAVLNTALQQQSQNLQKPLPTNKPTKDQQAHTLTFVSQNALPEGEAYEHFIATTGNIPTRDNLHDLFNGSIWLTFPKTKALLNYYHMLEMTQDADQQDKSTHRGRVRDTITVFDENGAILVTADPSIGEALIDFNWQASLVAPRDKWDNPLQLNKQSQAAVYIFGHALLEQLVHPRKPLCAHSIVLQVSQDFFGLCLSERMQYLDDKMAEYMDKLLSQNEVNPRQLAPLPILGVPHFWAENVNAEFYDDSYVFRSGRRRQA